jgi:hypothetical protein
MANGWKDDKCWSDRFIPEIKRILGGALISESAVEDDQERNTDLIVLTLRPYRIACRMRHNNILNDQSKGYGGQFTIRESRPTDGVKTELAKIIEGWGDYFFYGVADAEEQSVLQWGIGDLKVFRLWLMRWMASHEGRLPGAFRPNADGSSTFRAFNWLDVKPPAFIVAYRNICCLEGKPEYEHQQDKSPGRHP